MVGQSERFGQVHWRDLTENVANPSAEPGRAKATGIILAGGRSRRFGSDKAAAMLAGGPLIQHVAARMAQACSELVVVRAPDQEQPLLLVEVPVLAAQDSVMDQGPLAGVIAGLEAATNELCFVVATDAPLIVPALVAAMLSLADEYGHDVICPDIGGYRQPLVSVYRNSKCLPAFRRSLDAGNRRILVAYEGLRVHAPSEEDIRGWDPDLRSFRNANTAEALAELEALLPDDA